MQARDVCVRRDGSHDLGCLCYLVVSVPPWPPLHVSAGKEDGLSPSVSAGRWNLGFVARHALCSHSYDLHLAGRCKRAHVMAWHRTVSPLHEMVMAGSNRQGHEHLKMLDASCMGDCLALALAHPVQKRESKR